MKLVRCSIPRPWVVPAAGTHAAVRWAWDPRPVGSVTLTTRVEYMWWCMSVSRLIRPARELSVGVTGTIAATRGTPNPYRPEAVCLV